MRRSLSKFLQPFTVRSICTLLGPDIPAGSTDNDLEEMHCDPDLDPFNNPSRVLDRDGRVRGIVWFEKLLASGARRWRTGYRRGDGTTRTKRDVELFYYDT